MNFQRLILFASHKDDAEADDDDLTEPVRFSGSNSPVVSLPVNEFR